MSVNARVLVVDDSPTNVALVRAQLERAGYTVETAGGGQAALEAVAAREPDLLLLDVMMPGMDGYEVCRRLKGNPATRPIPIVMLTALHERQDRLRAFEVGADEFLSKPFDRVELLARVASLVRQRELSRAKDELVSVVSHELRTPLASLVGFAELLLLREFGEAERREFLTIMLEEGRRLTALINDFLDVQRMESGRQTITPVPTAPGPLLTRAAAAAGQDPKCPVVLDLPPTLPNVAADPDRIQQVIGNLLSNARKFSPGGGIVRLAARRVGSQVEISVADEGLGLPADALPRLFTKFYRVDNSDRREIKGTGLGLAVCRQIIAVHGGEIRAESEGLGKGARFSFTLPIAQTIASTGDVLIAEDDSGFARLVEAMLRPLGLSAVRVGSAETAIEQAEVAPPRAVVLDLLLPGAQGEAVLPRLRQVLGSDIPIVVVTVKELGTEEHRFFEEQGVVTVLRKGPGVAAMAARVIAEAIEGGDRSIAEEVA